MNIANAIKKLIKGELRAVEGTVCRFGSLAGPDGGSSFQFMLEGDGCVYELFPSVNSLIPLSLTKEGDVLSFKADANNYIEERDFENKTLNSFLAKTKSS